jgi:hypothetical protein
LWRVSDLLAQKSSGARRPAQDASARQPRGPLIQPCRNLPLELIRADQPQQRPDQDFGHHDQQLTCIVVVDQGVARFEITTEIGRDQREGADLQLVPKRLPDVAVQIAQLFARAHIVLTSLMAHGK